MTVPDAPQLFTNQQAAAVDPVVDGQAAAARRLMTGWWDTHGTEPHDKKFVKWLKKHAPAPPPAGKRLNELTGLRSLAAKRTPEGEAAAKWLDDNGKDVAWLSLAEQTISNPGAIHKDTVREMFTLSDRVSDQLKNKFGQPSPYVLDPTLNDGQSGKSGHNCTCSYPSGHATASGAAATYFSGLDPADAATYKAFRDQVEFSRMYVAGHVPSDLAAGTLLGDAIGEYFLVTREGINPT